MTLNRSLVHSAAAAVVAALISIPAAAQQGTVRHDRDNDPPRIGADVQGCQPGLSDAVRRHPVYLRIFFVLNDVEPGLRNGLDDVVDQASYAVLLARARALVARIENSRLVITLPDGTVVLDTARRDDPTNVLEEGNSYMHFVEKTVNENHNSRVAIMAAQWYPCGVAVERKLSTTTNQTESYVALRLGRHLDSAGTARLSIVQ